MVSFFRLGLYLILGISVVYGQHWEKEAVITQPTGDFDDGFGVSIALEDDWLFIGMPFKDQGVVMIYRLTSSGWNLEQELIPDGETFGRFGEELDVSGDRLIVGAPNGNGHAIIYALIDGVWNQVVHLNETHFNDVIYFGSSVSISENRVVIGARGYGTDWVHNGGVHEYMYGSVFVYRWQGDSLQLEQQLCPCAMDQARDREGWILDSNDSLIVMSGSMQRNFMVYGFEGGEWNLINTLETGIYYCLQRGTSTVILDDEVLLGVTGGHCYYNWQPVDAVFRYSYDDSQVIVDKSFSSSRDQAIMDFGFAMSGHGNSLVVSAPEDSSLSNSCGSVYAYEKCNGEWNEIQIINADNKSCQFGKSVALNKQVLAVAELSADDDSTGLGKVHIYRKNDQRIVPSFDGIDIYPNPTTGFFWIESKSGFLPRKIEVYDSLGNLIKEDNRCCDTRIMTINLGLSEGIYYLRLSSETDFIVTKVIITD